MSVSRQIVDFSTLTVFLYSMCGCVSECVPYKYSRHLCEEDKIFHSILGFLIVYLCVVFHCVTGHCMISLFALTSVI